jgi:hypothetical protein
MSAKPTAVDWLDVSEVKDGLVVYDPTRDRVHYLNVTAAVVFTLCDGGRDRDGIAEAVSTVFGVDAVGRTEIDDCLVQLEQEGVVRSSTG